MNVKTALASIKALGMSARHVDGEYRVTYQPHEMNSIQREECAFYTNDADDAVNTARYMRLELDRKTGNV